MVPVLGRSQSCFKRCCCFWILLQKANEEEGMTRANQTGAAPSGGADHFMDILGPEPDITLVSSDATQPDQIIFPKILFHIVRHGHNFPLAFFVPQIMKIICANIPLYQQVRVSHEQGKVFILDIEDIRKKLNDETGPTRNEDLTIVSKVSLCAYKYQGYRAINLHGA